MKTIYKKLNDIKKKPDIYLGRKSLELLDAFINGYCSREFEEDNNCINDFLKFDEFVRNQYKIQEEFNWLRIIQFYTNTDEEAFDLFFDLLDKFLV